MRRVYALLIITCLLVLAALPLSPPSAAASTVVATKASTLDTPVLSPFWSPNIQRWSPTIGALSEVYGFHPDFIAAVLRHESDGRQQAISHMGAVGLMGVGGVGPPEGTNPEWRPSSEELLSSVANLRWGMAILSYVVQQSGGDLYTALAAYNSGWDHVNRRIPREYAASILDSYGRALITRAGLSPQIANRWTVAVEIKTGNVPAEPLLVLGDKSMTTLQAFTHLRLSTTHVVYAYADQSGRVFYIRGYAVPIGLSELIDADAPSPYTDELEGPLRARLGEKSARRAPGNPRVLLACLPSMLRLRGQIATRWFSPSNCPAVERQE
jgi:hypothetical protein